MGVTSSMWHIQLLVWLSIYGFACWSTSEAVLFSQGIHLLLDPVYRVSPASHLISAGTWYRQLYFSLGLGKHLPAKTGICSDSKLAHLLCLKVPSTARIQNKSLSLLYRLFVNLFLFSHCVPNTSTSKETISELWTRGETVNNIAF